MYQVCNLPELGQSAYWLRGNRPRHHARLLPVANVMFAHGLRRDWQRLWVGR